MNKSGQIIRELQNRLRISQAATQSAQARRRQSEATVGEYQSKMRLLMETSPEAIGHCDRTGRFLFANRKFAEIYGHSVQTLIGRQMADLFRNEQWESVRSHLEQVLVGNTVELDHCLEQAGKETRRLHYMIAPEIGLDQQVRGWLIVVADLSERTETERALEYNRIRRRIVSDSLALLLSAHDSEEIIHTLFLKVAEHLTAETFVHFQLPDGGNELQLQSYRGLEPEMADCLRFKLVGTHDCGIGAHTPAPIIANRIQENRDLGSEPLRKRGFQAYVGVPLVIGPRLVGTLAFLSRTKTEFSGDELEFIRLIAGYAAVVIDRARSERDLRESENRYRSLFENSLDAIFHADGYGRIIFCNPAAVRLSGFTPEQLRDELLPNLWSSAEQAATWAAFNRGLHGIATELETKLLRKDRSQVEVFVSVVPIQEQQRTTGVYLIARDITERKEAQRALQRTNESLEDRVTERTEVLMMAIQELRQSLSERKRLEEEILVISEREQARIGQDLHDDLGQQLAGMAMLGHLLASQLQAENHRKAQDAAQLTNYLSRSIETTRNLAKSLFPVELERGGLLLALQDLAQRTSLMTQVHCEVRSDSNFKCNKLTAIHLYRIVQESISNAIKHGKARNVWIECWDRSGQIELNVIDDGIGLNQQIEKQDGMGLHLFQYRARLIGAQITFGAIKDGGCKVSCQLTDPLPCRTESIQSL